MAVNYTQTISMDMIVSEIEVVLDWRHDILRQCFYPASQKIPAKGQAPDALLNWARKELERNNLDPKIVERLAHGHEELCRQAERVLKHAEGGTALTVELYDAFENQVNAYVSQIRRLYQDLADSAVSVDMTTGLRTVSGMRNDIKREQDRYDRKGTTFSVAAIEIDNVDELLQKYDRRTMDQVYAHAARVITRTIRSFDDAYYLGKGEFILMLKHVEFMDACSVMDRLRRELETTPVTVGSENIPLTGSFGIAEALQRESADSTLEHAKSALLEAKAAGGNKVSEYKEMSALLLYARDMAKKST